MSTLHDKHKEAMDLAESAFLSRMRGKHQDAATLFQKALDSEIAAIALLDASDYAEPTYSVLHRSAATLALDCNNANLAEKLTAKALARCPPTEIAEELRDLLEQIHFHRHLLLRGVTLGNDEMQMSLAGRGVGYGMVHSEEFLQRVSNASKVIYRIVERRTGMPFRERGRPMNRVRNDYEVFVSVPRAASFAITLKLGQPSEQLTLPGIVETAEVVDEFMDLMDLVNRSRLDDIRARITDPVYFRNFIALAKKLAPDGETVTQVGFTSTRRGGDRFVEVTKPKRDFPKPIPPAGDAPIKIVTVRGILRFADATHESGVIRLVEEEVGAYYDIKVPEGMMNDIVRPMWDSVVVVTGRKVGQYILLDDIQEE